MSFSIELLPGQVPDIEPGIRASLGRITLGTFQERFTASLMYWNPDDYRRHWKEALSRILGGFSTSCLITSMLDPVTAKFIFWWPMHCLDDTVFIQNQILFFDSLATPFDENDPFASVPERTTVNEAGEKVSEWAVSTASLALFLRNEEERR